MTEDEFKAKNERRLDLIEKRHSGFTREEGMRPFDEERHPGWKAECERRHHANLTDEERAELARLDAEVGDYLSKRFPMPSLAELEKRLGIPEKPEYLFPKNILFPEK